MGQNSSVCKNRGSFSDTDQSVVSSIMTSESSVRISGSSSSETVLNNGGGGREGGLDLENKFFVCSLIKEDPNRYSSRVYYRSAPAGGVPFKWEAEPGKPKRNSIANDSGADTFVPLSPPPSFGPSEGEKKWSLLHKKSGKHRRSSSSNGGKSRKVQGCSPFNIKNVWSSRVAYS